MTALELTEEWKYRFAERMAIPNDSLMFHGPPNTPEQEKLARAEADEWVRRFRDSMRSAGFPNASEA